MSPDALLLLEVVLVVAGVAGVGYAALRLGLSRQGAATVAALCLVVVVITNLIAGAVGARRAAPAVHPIALDAQRFAALRPSAIPGRGHVDEVRTVPRLPRPYDERRRTIAGPADGDVVVRGWAIAASAGLPGSAVFAVVDGRFAAEAVYGQDRPDVAEAFGVAACAASGFTLTLHGSQLGAGKHRLVIGVATPDGNGYETLGTPIVLALR